MSETIGTLSARDALKNYASLLEQAETPSGLTITKLSEEIGRMQTEVDHDLVAASEALNAGDAARAQAAMVEVQVDRRIIRGLQSLGTNLLRSTPPAATTTNGVNVRRSSTPSVRLSSAQIDELGDAVRSAIRGANADSIFDDVSAQFANGRLLIRGYVHGQETAERLQQKLEQQLGKKTADGTLPALQFDTRQLTVASNSMRARNIKASIVSHLYGLGFDIRREDLNAAGAFGRAPFRSPMGEMSGHPRSFGILVDDSGNVTVTGEVRFARRWPFMLRDAARGQFMGKVTMATSN